MIASLPPPVPIGVGPAYRPAPAALTGRPVGAMHCTTGGRRFGVHLELFARRRVVIVPSGIGVARGCTYPARTREPTGVIEVRRGAHLTLGDLFLLWRKPVTRTRLLDFHGRVLAFVGGKRFTGDPREIALKRHAEIVLEIGGHVQPHTSYLFPEGL
jgi:hypothetical protein